MRFKSAIDIWLWAIVVLEIFLGMVMLSVTSYLPWRQLGLLALAFLPAIVIPVWLFTSTYYEVQSEVLRIKCGPFSWRIPLDQIRSVKKSPSLLSGPALSLQRLKILYNDNKSIVVSPKDQERFLAAIGKDLAGN